MEKALTKYLRHVQCRVDVLKWENEILAMSISKQMNSEMELREAIVLLMASQRKQRGQAMKCKLIGTLFRILKIDDLHSRRTDLSQNR